MDGYGTPEQHVQRAVDLGMPFLGLTEHGNVSSHVRLEKAALKAGIKPIFGCELYTGAVGEGKSAYKWHLTVLAENEIGYQNLNKLVSRGWSEGFYYEPTVSGEMLAEHSEGLVVLSGCSASYLTCQLLGGKGVAEHEADYAAARAAAIKFQDLLGDRYFLETQTFPELDRTRSTNQALERISEETGIQLVATGDVHFPREEDSDMRVILHAAGRGNKSFEQQKESWGYDIPGSPPLSDKAVYDSLVATGLSKRAAKAAILNAAEIGQRATVTLPKADRLRYPCPSGTDSASLFRRWVHKGWKYRGMEGLSPEKSREYKARLRYEMGLIEDKDFTDYFLMLSDMVRFAKNSGIPVGPARGSAAASLVCYLLRITEIDPMEYPTMLFERFIDATRADLPDVDLDFADDRRDEVRQYLISKYGADRVGNIGNFIRYRGKNAVNDVARVRRIPKDATAIINGLVVERSGGDSRFDASLQDTFDMFPAARAVLEQYPDLADAVRLEGNMRGLSVHAAGLVVSNTPLTDICAVYQKTIGKDKRSVAVLSIDKYDAEYLNILKIDALGLKTMGMISIALDLIGMSLEELYAIPMDDPETLKGFKNVDVVGIFQFEGRATRLVCADVSPDNFMEIADCNALSRPGPLFSGMTADYVDVKHGRKEQEHYHKVVDDFTMATKGQIVYQEQVLSIIREIGGFPVTKVAEIRRIISKKLGEAQFNTMLEDFIAGAKERHNIGRDVAIRIWKFMVTSATYSFNVAHSVSYSMLAFWTMWLKVHHPAAFYVASLRKEADADKVARLLKDAAKHGIDVRPPDIALSGITWEPLEENGQPYILAGFKQIYGVGDKQAADIIEFREENPGELQTWGDLLKVRGIGPKKLEGIRGFAESDDPFGLRRAERLIAKVFRAAEAGDLPVPRATHTSDDMDPQTAARRVVWWGIVRLAEYKDLIEDERSRTGDDVEEIKKRIKSPGKVKSCVLHCYDQGDEDVYLRIDRFKFGRMKSQLEAIRPDHDVVIAVGQKRKGFGVSLRVEKLFVVDPDG